MAYVLPLVTLVLLVSGFIIQKRSRSPYEGVAMDDQSKRQHRVGERLGFLGIVVFLIQELVRGWR
jgi:hypothetical protein